MFADDDINSEMPSSERIPSVLMETFLGKGYMLFTDNYFTSPTIAKYLIANKTHLHVELLDLTDIIIQRKLLTKYWRRGMLFSTKFKTMILLW